MGICIQGRVGQTPPQILRDTVDERALRILLECIHVNNIFMLMSFTIRRFKALIEPNNSATSYSNTVLNYGATSRLDVVFLIPSTNDDEAVRRRQAIRRTWANHTKHLPLATRHVFVLGMNISKDMTHDSFSIEFSLF